MATGSSGSTVSPIWYPVNDPREFRIVTADDRRQRLNVLEKLVWQGEVVALINSLKKDQADIGGSDEMPQVGHGHRRMKEDALVDTQLSCERLQAR